jgi:Flp pilus assembly pilin Flp
MRKRLGDILRRLWSDERGQTTIEYALLLAVIGLPAYAIFALLLAILTETYRMVTFLELLPFP